MEPARRRGRIVTFYSYKGGTGRSMALANIAWILACNGKRVLTIDWDLEAPGLHRYFRPFLLDAELSASEGLIDLIDRYATAAIAPVGEGAAPPPDWYLDYADFSDHVLGLDFAHFPRGGKIDLLPAGRQSDTYAIKVSSFNWQNFYDRLGGGAFLEAVKERARADYDYVLIDSRTGVSDTAGICTAQLPDTLVVCFTYNNQSIKGAAAVARSALSTHARLAEQRTALAPAARSRDGDGAAAPVIEDTPLPYAVYPVPMRVDAGESERLALRQAFARESFADLVTHIGASEIDEYWSAVEVPHRVFYAYEEVLAPFKDDAHDPKTVLAAFLRLTAHITQREVTDYLLPIAPEVRHGYLEAFAETPLTAQAKKARAEAQRESAEQALVRNAEAALYSLGDEEKQAAQQVLCRLVRLGRDEEGGGHFAIRAAMGDFDFAQRGVVGELARRGVLSVSSDSRARETTTQPPPIPGTQSSSLGRSEQSVALADARLVALWPTLVRWIDADRDFLLWRQQLRTYLADWDRSARDRGAMLSGTLLAEAQLWLHRRSHDLNSVERAYIEASVANANRFEKLAVATPTLPPEARAQAASPAAATLPPGGASAPSAVPSWPSPPQYSAPPQAATSEPMATSPARRSAVPALALGALLVAALIGGAWWLLQGRGHPGTSPGDGAASATMATATPIDPVLKRRLEANTEIGAGDIALAAGDAARAAASYSRALEIDPDHLEAALKLGRTRESQNDYAGAERAYAQAMQIAPGNAAPWLERAASRAEQGRFADAVADYTQALSLQGDDANAYFNRGAANEGLKRTSAAVADYTSALRLKPDFIAALLARARLVETSRPQAAAADYQSVLALPASAADQQLARDRLRALGPTPANASQPTTPRVVLQYRDAQDLARVQELRTALAGSMKSVSVTQPERRANSSGDVRYFFPADEPFARQVLNTTELLLAKQGVRSELRLRRLESGDFADAQAGTVEVWLPSLDGTQPLSRPAFVQRQATPSNAVPRPLPSDPPPQIYRK